MKAARLHAYDEQLRVEDVAPPELQSPTDVIVRIGGAGLCRTDLHIIEGVWREKVDVELPYILGHENAGWVEDVGSQVKSIKPGDAVIVHPVVSCGLCRACRAGEDMHCESLAFPGITTNGGFAEYLRTGERAVIPLPEGLEPKAIAPYADAGITAYRAAKRAAVHLYPGTRCAVIGVGGLGHIAVQVLHALCATEVIAVDRSAGALELCEKLGAEHLVNASEGDPVEQVKELTGGHGAEAVIDFVGEGSACEQSVKMLRNGGIYWVVGYGGMIQVPAIDMIFSEIAVVGSLVGNYNELAELMTLAGQGKVHLHGAEYRLDDINTAIHDLEGGRLRGRGVLVP
ncbi:MAG TPA: NAD(P)-dependent alcohol dehydrogenase [Miltoncostaeaceae bacterium]|nr:NAD(P)-dependent alcohol dehydrogenase [Miltoncostaeaceae bacterium]